MAWHFPARWLAILILLSILPAGRGGASAGIPVSSDSSSFLEPDPQGAGEYIVKQVELSLLVRDTQWAVGEIARLAEELGGEMESYRVWNEAGYPYASLTVSLPAGSLEASLRRLRAISLDVLTETVTTENISEKYVDLQSSQRALRARQEHLLGMAALAQSEAERSRLSEELTGVEQQLGEIQRQLDNMQRRAQDALINIQIEPLIPTTTPTLTRTPRPTRTPVPWSADRTYQEAVEFRGDAVDIIFGTSAAWAYLLVCCCLPGALGFLGLQAIIKRRRERKLVNLAKV